MRHVPLDDVYTRAGRRSPSAKPINQTGSGDAPFRSRSFKYGIANQVQQPDMNPLAIAGGEIDHSPSMPAKVDIRERFEALNFTKQRSLIEKVMPVDPIRLISFCSALQEADGLSSLGRERMCELHHMLNRLLTEVEQAR
jgi:hypothetical protein